MIRLAIRRPVAVTMAYAGIAALGAFAWRNIPLELLPDTQLPRLTVSATWPGTSPETVEAFLTSPLEAVIQQVGGVEKITSDSFEQQGTGLASIEVEFARGSNMDFARLELSERISTLQEDLPPGVGTVAVTPFVPEEFRDQNRPFLSYTLTGPYTLEALRAHVEDVVRPALTELEGVALVVVRGGRARRLEIQLDPEVARSLGLTPEFLRQRIAGLDLVREAGVVREGAREWTVTIANRPTSPQDIVQAVIATAGDKLVRVGDVARVSDTFAEATGYARIDGRPAVTFELLKEIGSNTIEVADRVKVSLAELERRAPHGSRYLLVADESADIRRHFSDLRARAVVSALVIFVVLLAFLRSFASAGIVYATIAFSVLITLNVILLSGLTLNLLTLMGIAMAFGLLVDSCIVVLENTYRRWQQGEEASAAAEGGAREVAAPILASTATNLIVFVPFVYLQGELRVYYVPLAIVVGITQIASLLVAFTFIPSLSARVLRHGTARLPADAALRAGPMRDPFYLRFYAGMLGWTLRVPWLTVATMVSLFAGSAWLFDRYVTRGRVWGGFGDTDSYIQVLVNLPRGSSLERTDELVRYFEGRIAKMQEVEQYETTVTGTFGQIEITFPDSLENTYVPVAIKEEMMAYSYSFTGADIRVYGYGPSFYGGGGSAPNYRLSVFGYNYGEVREIAEDLGVRLTSMSRIDEVDTNASGRFTRDRAIEYVVTIDRDALARYDLTTEDLVSRLRSAIGGASGVDRLKLGGEDVEFQVKIAGSEEADVLALLETLIQLSDGRQARLGDVVTVAPREVLASIHREDQQYQRTVAYEFRGPTRLGDAVRDAMLARTVLPPGYRVERAQFFFFSPEDRRQIYMVLAVSLVLVFMVTAAVFESVRLPLCVLLAVPMGLIGIFLMFFYTNATFTREAYIGVIMASGIVVNNAILLVDHINRMRGRPGMSFQDAVVRGTLERVRPILMTSATTVFGLLPLVLFSASDANIWNALAFTLIGGMLSSTLLVLTVTPALYTLFERGRGPTSVLVQLGAASQEASD